MDVEGSTSELANRGRSEEETAQLRNIPRLFSKYSEIPNKATSKRSTSVRSQLLKYLEITNKGEHFNENIFEFWETMENQLPALYKLAMQVLFVPASSAPVERIFSTGGLIMRPHRSRLSSVNLDADCIKMQSQFYCLILV